MRKLQSKKKKNEAFLWSVHTKKLSTFTRHDLYCTLLHLFLYFVVFFLFSFSPQLILPHPTTGSFGECAQITHFSIRPITFLMLSKRATVSCKHVWVIEWQNKWNEEEQQRQRTKYSKKEQKFAVNYPSKYFYFSFFFSGAFAGFLYLLCRWCCIVAAPFEHQHWRADTLFDVINKKKEDETKETQRRSIERQRKWKERKKGKNRSKIKLVNVQQQQWRGRNETEWNEVQKSFAYP